jgi:hypothetical protein
MRKTQMIGAVPYSLTDGHDFMRRVASAMFLPVIAF